MQPFFNPESVAVIGVSSSPANLAKRILHNLKRFRFKGKVFAVGPRDEEVEGYSLFRSVLDIEDNIDLAVLLVPAKSVPRVVEQCGSKGIKNLIIESGGFREYEGIGSNVERELIEVCKSYDIKFIGPNCLGVIQRQNGLCTPFFTSITPFVKGGISVLSQSGGVGISFAMDLTDEYVGIENLVSYGNGLDIDETDLLEYFGEDENTEVIAGYVEGISRGRDFMRAASRIKKPIIMLKSNTQPMAAPIAASHSAVMTGDERVLNAAFKQSGVVRVPNAMAWTGAAKQLTLPMMKGNRLAILSRSGGHAVLATDAAERSGFEMAGFPPEFYDACRRYFLNSVIKLQNPLDLGQIFYHPVLKDILEETLKLDEVDGVLFIHTYDGFQEADLAHEVISQIKPLMQQYNKPVATMLFTDMTELEYVQETYRLPLFGSPFHGIEALSFSRDAYKSINCRPFDEDTEIGDGARGKAILKEAIDNKRNPSLMESLDLLKTYGQTIVDSRMVFDKSGLNIAESIGYPVALKISHPDASHKSDVNGVKLYIKDYDSLASAWEEMCDKADKACLKDGMSNAVVQKMVKSGWEFFVGAKRDPRFGPVVMAGLGGTLAEVIDDVKMRVAPITREDAIELLDETRASTILGEYRGKGESDKEALIELLLTVSTMMLEIEEIDELDINPVFVHAKGDGLSVVDARVILKS